MADLERPDDGPASPSSGVEEIEFSVTDATYPFVDLSASEDCEVRLQRMVPRGGGRYAEFFAVDDAGPDRVVSRAEDHPHLDASVVSHREDGGLFEFVVSDACPARDLAELGALPRVVRGTEGHGRIVAEVPPGVDTSAVIESLVDAHPAAELLARRPKDHETPLFSARELELAVDDRLTDRQQEVLRAAFEAGYYDQPRRTEARTIAADLGISGATFSQHVRAAERNLLAMLYNERAI